LLFSVLIRRSSELLARFGNPDPVDMKVYCPEGEETFHGDETHGTGSEDGRACRCLGYSGERLLRFGWER
jgi:hypothetical protein